MKSRWYKGKGYLASCCVLEREQLEFDVVIWNLM